jgi:hypothetical protein
MTIPARELLAVEIIKNSWVYSGLGHCTSCLVKLTKTEQEKNQQKFELIDRMITWTLNRQRFESYITDQTYA